MSRPYNGPATIVVGNLEIPATVSLAKRIVGNIPEWDGTVSVAEEHVNTFEAAVWDLTDHLQVRVPEGREGNAIIRQMNAGSGHAVLSGSGPAPW